MTKNPRCLALLVGALLLACLPSFSWASEAPYLVEKCQGNILNNPQIIKVFQAIYSTTGKKATVTSCSRTWSKKSQHRVGVAVDLKVPGYTGVAMCQLLNKVRNSVVGHGGIGNYYGNRSHIGHIDLRQGRASWDRCKGMFGDSSGYSSQRVESYWNRMAPALNFEGDFRLNRESGGS